MLFFLYILMQNPYSMLPFLMCLYFFSLYYHHFSLCTKHTYAIHIYVARRKKRRKIRYINIQNQKNREREDGYCWGTELRALNTKNFLFYGIPFFGSFKEYSFALWNTHFGSNFGWNKKILYPPSYLTCYRIFTSCISL